MGRSGARRPPRDDRSAQALRSRGAAREAHPCRLRARRRKASPLPRSPAVRPPPARHRGSLAARQEDAQARSGADRPRVRRGGALPTAQAQARPPEGGASRPGCGRGRRQHLRRRVAVAASAPAEPHRQHGEQAVGPPPPRGDARVAAACDRQPRQLRRHLSRRVGRGRGPAGEAARVRTRGRAVLHVRAAAELGEDRGADHRLLPALPAVTPLIPRLFGIVFLGVAFIAMTIAVAAGAFMDLDLQVAQAMSDAWQPSLHGLFQAIAELGSLELTTVLTAGLTFYLWRSGFGSDALVFIVFIAAQVFELYYKLNLGHRQPPRSLVEEDGPSITQLFSGGELAGNSFPSGHVLRAVAVYGLLAFVIRRLATSPRLRSLALVVAVAIVALVSFD